MQEPAHENSGETAKDTDRRPDGMPVGKPFEKGASGNPRGRPKGIARQVRDRLAVAARENEDPSAALVDFFADVMSDPSNSTRDRMYAGNWLSERGWGKAPAFAPIEDDDPLDLSVQRQEELAADLVARIDEVSARRQQHDRERLERERAADGDLPGSPEPV